MEITIADLDHLIILLDVLLQSARVRDKAAGRPNGLNVYENVERGHLAAILDRAIRR